MILNRRSFLAASTSLAASLITPSFAETSAMTFDRLRRMAASRAAVPHVPLPPTPAIGYDRYRSIVFRPDKALWKTEGTPFLADFFHAGNGAGPVTLFRTEDGAPIRYDRGSYDFFGLDSATIESLPNAYAGLRLHARLDGPAFSEFLVFMGASYFRALASGMRYGLSARGIAVDTGLPGQPEEFPAFTSFWLETPDRGAETVSLLALIDGPSMAGAYRLTARPGDTTRIDVEAEITLRHGVARLGLAPLTSMYHFSPSDPGTVADFRPSVHDSDGLAIETSGNDMLWRPLTNPGEPTLTRFAGRPSGFGLIQRARDFADTLDLEARYDLRPSAWIEPGHDWPDGDLVLYEIPTRDETSDNIVAFFEPQTQPAPGSSFRFSYRMSWGPEPASGGSSLLRARRIATGRGGLASDIESPDAKVVIDFRHDKQNEASSPSVALTDPPGNVRSATLVPNAVEGGWRVYCDVAPSRADDIRLWLEDDGHRISEIVIVPPAIAARREFDPA